MSDDIIDRAKQALDGVDPYTPWDVEQYTNGTFGVYAADSLHARVLNGRTAHFIAAARSLVPELADEIINLRAERDQWKALWQDTVAEAAAAIEERDKAVAASEPRRIE